MSRPLTGKVVVIVGGTSGLGFSAALACVDAGAWVVVVGRDPESARLAETELGEAGRVVVGDAVDPATVERAIDLAVDEFRGFDGLYHVAGGSGRKSGDGPLDRVSDAGWAATLELNLTSLFHSDRAAVRRFLQRGTPGSVVNVGSVLAFSPSSRYFATHAYAAAKAAVVGLTRSAAAYYASRDIRFNVVAPALVETPMSRRARDDAEILDYIATKQPLDGGRIGVPEDVDGAVVFLLSDAARWVTGQVLTVDGGWSVTEGQYRCSAGEAREADASTGASTGGSPGPGA